MLNFSVGDIANAVGVQDKIGGLDLNKISVADALGVKKDKKKKQDDGLLGRLLGGVLGGSGGSDNDEDDEDKYPTTAN